MSAATEDPPLLSLAGGSARTVLRVASLSIAAIAEVEDCVNSKTSELTYEWSELRTGGAFISTSKVRCTAPSVWLFVEKSLAASSAILALVLEG